MNAKKPIYSALVILALAGCASGNSFRAGNRMKLLKLSPGMSKTEVLDVMGVGEQRVCCPLRTVTNPHRTEAYSAGGSRFEVLYYYTGKKKRIAVTIPTRATRATSRTTSCSLSS